MRLVPAPYKKVIKFLESKGFYEDRQKGGHKIFKNKDGLFIVVPCHPREQIGIPLLHKILKEGNFTREEWLSFKK